MLQRPVCARGRSTQTCSRCFEAHHIPQALRLILSPRGSASALVPHAERSFNSCLRHARTRCTPFAQRGDSASQVSATRPAFRAYAAVSAAGHRAVKERWIERRPTECATAGRSRTAATAIERRWALGFSPWRRFLGDKVVAFRFFLSLSGIFWSVFMVGDKILVQCFVLSEF